MDDPFRLDEPPDVHDGQPLARRGTAQMRFRLVPFDQIALSTSPRYRVKGLLPISGLAVFWGPPKCGKSFFVFDLLMHVALGWTYRDRRVVQGLVIYAALEGQSGFEARAAAFRQRFLPDDAEVVPFYLMPTPLSLVKDAPVLIREIRAQLRPGDRPAVVCLDTLNRSFVGSESDDEAMTAYVKAADAIRDTFGCLVVIVHHCGLEGQRPRGHSSLAGAVDAQIGVKKTGEGDITVTVDLMKDGPEGAVLTCRLESVDVGQDDDGESITSCVVVPLDGAPQGMAKSQGGRRMPDRHRLALQALAESLVSLGKPAPPSFGLPAGILVVPVERWREELHARGVIEADDANPRATFKRLKAALAARALIGEREGLIWSVAPL